MDNNPIQFNDVLGLYTERQAKRLERAGKRHGYTTTRVENRNKEGDIGLKFEKEIDGVKYFETYYSGRFKGARNHEAIVRLSADEVNFYNEHAPDEDKKFHWYFQGLKMGQHEFDKLARGFRDYQNQQMSLPVWERSSSQGGASPCDGFWQGFIGFGIGGSTSTARVFWSGGNVAKTQAANFAKSKGMITLEMTTSGRVMNTINPLLPKVVSRPIWDKLSSNFATGAVGEINVFHNVAGVSMNSTWKRIEYKILENNEMIFHNVR